ncbi:MAG: Gfo/Idh/MocA family oxidoreductase [Planctomycetes bacterium]|nr:Gfo/Idh/MocA family oxidoreductase [Planctomycetota bacterium]
MTTPADAGTPSTSKLDDLSHPRAEPGAIATAKLDRRTFTAASAAGVAAAWGLSSQTAASAAKIDGANGRVRVGFIGVGNRGMQLFDSFRRQKDVEIVAAADVFSPYLDKARQRNEGKLETTGDFRKLIDRKDLDAIVVATPDHWHAIQTIMACDSGKDVYVEKPLSITVFEGRRMVEAARRNDRIVQVGTHRRSSTTLAGLAEQIAKGKLGHVTVGHAYRISDMYPGGIGRRRPTPAPKDLDWDMWLGPRPERPFQDNIAPYKFRWWHLYSSQMGNWGVHYFDVMRWMVGELAPASVCALGGKFAVDDDRTVPDTAQAVLEFASGRLLIFGQYEATGTPLLTKGEAELRGTLGTATLNGNGAYVIEPARGGQFQTSEPRLEPQTVASPGHLDDAHVRNFVDCVKSRQRPNADVEIGHRSTTMSLLANISLATRLRLEWDADKEQITNSKEANAMLHYEYRSPWKLG